MQTFYMTDAGKVRTHNEDSVIIVGNKNNEFILSFMQISHRFPISFSFL